MDNWFEVSASFVKEMESGTEKRVREKYMVSAVSCTDAEARVVSELEGCGELEVKSVSAKEISDVLMPEDGEGCSWFLVKVNFVTLDEKSGREKKVPTLFLVQAKWLGDAQESMVSYLKKSMNDWELAAITLTSIVDVFMND